MCFVVAGLEKNSMCPNVFSILLVGCWFPFVYCTNCLNYFCGFYSSLALQTLWMIQFIYSIISQPNSCRTCKNMLKRRQWSLVTILNVLTTSRLFNDCLSENHPQLKLCVQSACVEGCRLYIYINIYTWNLEEGNCSQAVQWETRNSILTMWHLV